MNHVPSDEELPEYLADAIAACWVRTVGVKEGLEFFTLEEMVRVLNHQLLSWANPETHALLLTWTDVKLWDLLHRRFGAVDNPNGVLTFARDQVARAIQRRDYLSENFPKLIDLIETTLSQIA